MWELWEWEERREAMEVVDRRQHTPQLKENDGPLQVPETGFASCWGNRFCSRWETVLPPKRSCSRTGSGGSALHHLTKWACFLFTHRLSLLVRLLSIAGASTQGGSLELKVAQFFF